MAWYESLLEPVLSIKSADRRFICALEHLKRAIGGLARARGVTGCASGARWPHARNDHLGRVQAFTHTLALFTHTMALEGETGWIGDTGREAGPCGDLPRLLQLRTRLRALRSACRTLAPLIRIQFLRPLAGSTPRERASAPRTVAFDALSVADAETQLAAAVTHLDRVLTALQRAIYLATHQQDARILWARTGSWAVAAEGDSGMPMSASPLPLRTFGG